MKIKTFMAFFSFLNSLEIILENLGKRYNQNWIFRGLTWTISKGQALAILGNNGSGKSTLLQMILGSQTASEGQIRFLDNSTELAPETIYRVCSIAAPYLDLFEELSLVENFQFAKQFHGVSCTQQDFLEITGLSAARDRQLKFFSSGMKQRVKLGLALLSPKPVVLLDEPCSNLDAEGMQWYNELVSKHQQNRILIVSSNSDPMEMGFCTVTIDIRNYKNNG